MLLAHIVFTVVYLITFDPIIVEISLYTLLFIQIVSVICYVLWLRVVYQLDSRKYGWQHLWLRYVCQAVISCWPILLLLYLRVCHISFTSTLVVETIVVIGFCYICSALWNIYQLTFSPNSSHPLIAFSLSLISSDMYGGVVILSIGISLLLVTVFANNPLMPWIVAVICYLSLTVLIWLIVVLVRRRNRMQEKSQERRRDGQEPEPSIALSVKRALYGPIIVFLVPPHVVPSYNIPLFICSIVGLAFLLTTILLTIKLTWIRRAWQKSALWQESSL